MVGTKSSGRTDKAAVAKMGEKTRFGAPGGPDPVAAALKVDLKPYFSVRSELRYLFAQEIDDDPAKLDEELKRLRRKKGKVNMARLFACRMIEKGFKKMDAQMANSLIDQMEGKNYIKDLGDAPVPVMATQVNVNINVREEVSKRLAMLENEY